MPAPRLTILTLLAAATASLAACNLITGLSDDYHLQIGSAAPDGSPDEDSGDGEGGSGVGHADGSEPPDTGVPDGGAFSCATVDAQFCTDFDTADVGDGGLDTVKTEVGATIGVRDGVGVGGSRGLETKLVWSGGGSANAWSEKTLEQALPPSTFDNYDVELELKVLTATLAQGRPAELAFTSSGNAEYAVSVYANTPTLLTHVGPVDDGGVYDTNPPSWHHVVIALARPKGTMTYTRTLTIDGKIVETVPNLTQTTSGSSVIRLGTFSTDTENGTLDFVFDDVFARWW